MYEEINLEYENYHITLSDNNRKCSLTIEKDEDFYEIRNIKIPHITNTFVFMKKKLENMVNGKNKVTNIIENEDCFKLTMKYNEDEIIILDFMMNEVKLQTIEEMCSEKYKEIISNLENQVRELKENERKLLNKIVERNY